MEIRTRVYPTECRFYCDKCAVFLDQGQNKDERLKYLAKEEFDKINDHAMDDSVLTVLTPDQVVSVLGSIGNIKDCIEYFGIMKSKSDATVKFFGEMIPSGPMNRFITPESRERQTIESLHQCNNPSCKQEMMLPRDYPYVEQSVGRQVRSPNELQHPDDEIRNVMKKHVGSTVMPNFKEEKK